MSSSEFLEFTNLIPEYITNHDFKHKNDNLIKTTYDIQGIEYSGDYSRKRYSQYRLSNHEPFRCCPIHPDEDKIHNDYFFTAKKDIFYSFNKFTPKIPIHITHFQVRKNFLLVRENEIAYTTKYGIQSFNLVNNIKYDLCTFITQENENLSEREVICFDITETDQKDYLICTGNSDGTIKLLKIKNEELKKKRLNKFSNKTKFDLIATEIISVGINSLDIFTNYVRFLGKGKFLLTTGNDGYIRIYNLEEKMSLVASYKSEYPVNHCSINSDAENKFEINSGGNLLGAVGDSPYIDLFDLHNQKLITSFKGHYDNGIVLRFMEGRDNCFVTGNQDMTCKIWDLRKIKNKFFEKEEIAEAQKILCSQMDSVGDICMINRDMFVFCENLDVFNIYNIKTDTVQSLDYIGHFAGVLYQKSCDKIHLGIKENHINGILTYSGIKNFTNSLESVNI